MQIPAGFNFVGFISDYFLFCAPFVTLAFIGLSFALIVKLLKTQV